MLMNEKQLAGLQEEFLTAGKVMNALSEIAPTTYSVLGDEEGLLMGNEDQKITKIGVSWYLSLELLNTMLKDGVDFIITHTYPFLRMKAAKLEGYTNLNAEALYPNNIKKKILRQAGAALYRTHSSWDNATGGNNDVMAKLLGLERVEKVPFGRTGFVKPATLKAMAEQIKKTLNCSIVKFSGNPETKITRIMIVTGTGFLFPELVEYCYTNGIDALVSGELIKETVKRANELGVALIDAGSHETETPGMNELAKRLKEKGFNAEYYDSGELYGYV